MAMTTPEIHLTAELNVTKRERDAAYRQLQIMNAALTDIAHIDADRTAEQLQTIAATAIAAAITVDPFS